MVGYDKELRPTAWAGSRGQNSHRVEDAGQRKRSGRFKSGHGKGQSRGRHGASHMVGCRLDSQVKLDEVAGRLPKLKA